MQTFIDTIPPRLRLKTLQPVLEGVAQIKGEARLAGVGLCAGPECSFSVGRPGRLQLSLDGMLNDRNSSVSAPETADIIHMNFGAVGTIIAYHRQDCFCFPA